ncbi:elongation factor 1-gamma-like protein [Tanacetum coccineum]
MFIFHHWTIMSSDLGMKNRFKARIAALYAAPEISKRDDFYMDSLEFIEIKPLGEDFVLNTPSGTIFGSDAIARYGEMHNSFWTSIYGLIEQWIGFSSVELDLNLRGLALLSSGYFNDHDKLVEFSYTTNLKIALKALDTHLTSHDFLVGDSVTLADIITACNLLYGFKLLMSKKFTSKFPHVEKYFWAMINRPKFQDVIGKVKQADDVFPGSRAMKSKRPKKAEPKEVPKNEEVPMHVAIVKDEDKPKALDVVVVKKEAPHSPLAVIYGVVFESFLVRDCSIVPHFIFKEDKVFDEWKKFYSHIKSKSNLDEHTIKGYLDFFTDRRYPVWFFEYKNARPAKTKKMVMDILLPLELFRPCIFGKILITANMAAKIARYEVKGFWVFRPIPAKRPVEASATDLVIEHCKKFFVMTEVDLSVEDKRKRVIQMIKDEDPFEGEEIVHDLSYM